MENCRAGTLQSRGSRGRGKLEEAIRIQADSDFRSHVSGWQINNAKGTFRILILLNKDIHQELQEPLHAEVRNRRTSLFASGGLKLLAVPKEWGASYGKNVFVPTGPSWPPQSFTTL